MSAAPARKTMSISDMVTRLSRSSTRIGAGECPYWFTVTSPSTVRVTSADAVLAGAAVGVVTRDAAWVGDKDCSYTDGGKRQYGIRLERGSDEGNTEWIDRVSSALMVAKT